MKKIAIIGTAGIPANYGGFETLTENLVKHLHNLYELTVYCSSFNYKTKKESFYSSKLIYLPLKANGKASIIYDSISIIHSIFKRNDILLILGVSGAVIIPFIRFFFNKKIVTNIDGIEWKRNKWGPFAKFVLRFQEFIAVKYSDVIISDNKGIQDHVLLNYKKDSTLIAYGGSHVKPTSLNPQIKYKFNITEKSYAFSVCRIEPENNIHHILEAFSKVEEKLLFVGNWNKNEYGRALKKNYKNCANIIMIDPIYDQVKLDELRSNCKLYIHGHSAGGTNPSLVEAMYLGLPIIAWDINYNRYTTANSAIYFKNSKELQSLLEQLTTNKQVEVSNLMKNQARNNYSWISVVEKYKSVFNEL